MLEQVSILAEDINEPNPQLALVNCNQRRTGNGARRDITAKIRAAWKVTKCNYGKHLKRLSSRSRRSMAMAIVWFRL